MRYNKAHSLWKLVITKITLDGENLLWASSQQQDLFSALACKEIEKNNHADFVNLPKDKKLPIYNVCNFGVVDDRATVYTTSIKKNRSFLNVD